MRRSLDIRAAAAALALASLLAACGSDDDGGDDAPAAAATETSEAPAEPLRILYSNDDGITNPAIDVLLGRLSALPDVEVTLVAPADQRSGSSDTRSEGVVTYQEGATPAGVSGTAVNGFPADTVVVGLDELDLDPHLVVSGINPGQNIGPFAALSGTVGVGRTAIRRGVPALAVSANLQLDQEQFEFAAELALDWIEENRDALLAGTAQADTVTSINVPACPVSSMGELQETVLAESFPEGADPFASTCDQSNPDPVTDYDALAAGYPSIEQVPADL
ncbi:5'/3'-nucleotidase SurE [Blastococcus sp. URHD0036]|uniref:5'/3'-nucleotidase SurE n=1 Tax=Blastococcus sp. URHD0036 TaxID=1380356 RepID=UPI000690DF8A|nr:5'/3'-nucleotidase SurE [Blastococcus sp. URHD0036]